jgi:hypothetical protein
VAQTPVAYAVALSGSHAYVRGHNNEGELSLTVVDITNPESPQIMGVVHSEGLGGIGDVAVSGTYAFLADYESGLEVIDVTSPRNVQILGSTGAIETARVVVSGAYAYVQDAWAERLGVVDISNPEAPQLVGGLTVPYATGLAVSGEYACATAANIFKVIDLSNPQSLQVVGSVAMPEAASALAASGTYAYASVYPPVLLVIDFADPQDPQIVGSVDLPAIAHDVSIWGTHACVACGSSGLYVVDLADPVNPVLVGSLSTLAAANHVDVWGDLACVPDGYQGVLVIDIADPEDPRIAGSVRTPRYACGVELAGTRAYVPTLTTGVQVIDITNPESPQLLGGVDTPWEALGVAVSDSCVCVADRYGLVTVPLQCGGAVPVATINDLRARPTEDGIALTWHGGFDPELFDLLVYRRAADGSWSCLTDVPLAKTGPDFEFIDEHAESGVPYEYEIELVAGDGTRLRFGPVSCQLPLLHALRLDVRPMLTRGEFALGLNLPSPTDVRISLHDLAGRRLALLEQGLLQAGRHHLELNLKRVVGAQAPAGLYFVRLETPRGWMSRRIALVR